MHLMDTLTPSEAFREGRDTIRALVERHCTTNPRVFESVLMGRDAVNSNLDLLVERILGTTLFELDVLQDAREEALRIGVDVKIPT